MRASNSYLHLGRVIQGCDGYWTTESSYYSVIYTIIYTVESSESEFTSLLHWSDFSYYRYLVYQANRMTYDKDRSRARTQRRQSIYVANV